MSKPTGRPPIDPIVRFWHYVKKDTCLGDMCGCHKGLGCCWPWIGKIARNGYGHFADAHSRSVGAHRFAYTLHYGVFAAAWLVCHKCDVKRCVRGEHLFLGDGFDNMQDAAQKGRMPQGERNSHARLVAAQVLEIRALQGSMKQAHVARLYGITAVHVSWIWQRKTWKHI